MKIHIAHSPDSDDAFMFYGLASGKVPSLGYELEHVLSDIETLNRRTMNRELDVSAISFHAYPDVAQHYVLLPHGASFGDGYGPVVVAARPLGKDDLEGVRVDVTVAVLEPVPRTGAERHVMRDVNGAPVGADQEKLPVRGDV